MRRGRRDHGLLLEDVSHAMGIVVQDTRGGSAEGFVESELPSLLLRELQRRQLGALREQERPAGEGRGIELRIGIRTR